MKLSLKLRPVEIEHLLTLLEERKREGSYYGRREHYYKRTDKLINLLEEQLKLSGVRFSEA